MADMTRLEDCNAIVGVVLGGVLCTGILGEKLQGQQGHRTALKIFAGAKVASKLQGNVFLWFVHGNVSCFSLMARKKKK